MTNKNLVKILISALPLVPVIAYAQTVNSILAVSQEILNQVIPILMILATVVFLWGVITYITAGGDEDKLKTGRHFVIFGIVGLFIMVAAWGIVTTLVNTFGVGGTTIPAGPGTIGGESSGG
jgi:hypothetical protein